MNDKETLFSYLIDIFTKAKIYKVKRALGKDVDNLDEILDLILKAIDEYSELDLLNPHQNLSLKVKCVIKNEKNEILAFKNKKGHELISFTPSSFVSLKDDIEEHLKKALEFKSFHYSLGKLINSAELKENMLINEKIDWPIYLLTIKISLDSSKIIKDKYEFISDYSCLNDIDRYIVKEEEHVNPYQR